MTQAVLNRDICFIKTVVLLCEQCTFHSNLRRMAYLATPPHLPNTLMYIHSCVSDGGCERVEERHQGQECGPARQSYSDWAVIVRDTAMSISLENYWIRFRLGKKRTRIRT